VTTDTFRAEIDTAGGDLRRVELLKYRDTLDAQKNFVLLEDDNEHTYIAQSGVIGGPFPNHTSAYTVGETNYELQPGRDTLIVRLEAADNSGAKVAKTYTFRRGAYVVDIAFELSNPQSTAIEPVVYYQLLRDAKPAPGDSKMVPTFLGMEVYTEHDKLRKVSFEDIAKNLVVPHDLGMTTTLVVPKTADPFRENFEQEAVAAPHIDHITDDLAGFLGGPVRANGGSR